MGHFVRHQHPRLLLSGSSQGRPSWLSSKKALLPLACLVFGYVLGCSRFHNPYPIDMEAFQLPPGGSQPADADTAPAGSEGQHPPNGAAGAAADAAGAAAAAAAGAATGAAYHDHVAEEFLRSSLLMLSRPPVTPGRSGNDFYTVAPHQVLSWYPRIVLFPRFLSEAQAAAIIDLARPKLEPSLLGVGDRPTAAPGEGGVRTSNGVFFDSSEDPSGVLAAVEAKIADVTFIPPSHGEDFNVLRYTAGQHYHSHMDTWDERMLRRDPSFGQRMATMVLYLNDVAGGGETVFKCEGRFGAARYKDGEDLEGCGQQDFKYKPRAGDAILFFSLNTDRSVNVRALHGACPVAAGSEKWVATRWMHDMPVREWDGERRRGQQQQQQEQQH